ncbi:MAG: hypothetical protein ACTHOR_11920 [Devosia sp.]|jgi:hypothetical protein
MSKLVLIRLPGTAEVLLVDCEQKVVSTLPDNVPAPLRQVEGEPAVEAVLLPAPDGVSARMYYHQAPATADA